MKEGFGNSVQGTCATSLFINGFSNYSIYTLNVEDRSIVSAKKIWFAV